MYNAEPRRRPDITEVRRFYLALSALLAVLAMLGFWPRYFRPMLGGGIERDAVIHFHAAVYVGWLLLFIVQCALVAVGNIALHRKVGRFGLVYGLVVVVVGLLTTVLRFASRLEQGGIEQVEHTAIFPFMDMVLFSAFFGAAAYYRTRPELHKRLMIVAASSILIASTGRFSGSLGLEGASAHAVLLLLWLLPILFAMGYDALRYRMIHPVYVIGATVIAISSFRGPLQYTEAWTGFTHWLASVLS